MTETKETGRNREGEEGKEIERKMEEMEREDKGMNGNGEDRNG